VKSTFGISVVRRIAIFAISKHAKNDQNHASEPQNVKMAIFATNGVPKVNFT